MKCDEVGASRTLVVQKTITVHVAKMLTGQNQQYNLWAAIDALSFKQSSGVYHIMNVSGTGYRQPLPSSPSSATYPYPHNNPS